MGYKLTIEQKSGYLHAIVSGQNTKENVEKYLEDIVRECTANQCWRVLIEERLQGKRLEMMNVFEIASQGAMRSVGRFKAIAYVDVNAEGDLMQFAETVAINRGLPVRVFSTVEDAEKWLVQKAQGDPPPRAPVDAEKPQEGK